MIVWIVICFDELSPQLAGGSEEKTSRNLITAAYFRTTTATWNSPNKKQE
jgi:hypothetical protein